ncbi:MAG: hypothetical protein NUV94_02465 [Candidatus Acetothermia bacterium]|jgi:cation:H+ antiporter|nr:hypothetical protein [Candidatus Acetothermia bacterium]
MTWVLFFATAGAIIYAGSRLAFYGDALAEKTGLGRTWIGLVLVAATTSLPELITGLSASAVFVVPDIAVGNVLGACMLNLVMVAVLDAVGGRIPWVARVHHGHVLPAGFGLLLLGLVGAGLGAGRSLPSLGWISPITPLLFGGYLLALRLAFLHERGREFPGAREPEYARVPLRKALVRYGTAAAVVIAAAMFLPRLGEELARETGLGQALVGTLLIAWSTTLPELVVVVSAARLGAADLALGNLLGSVLFNLTILAVDDLVYTGGPLLAAVHQNHLVTVAAIVLMYALLLVGLSYQPRRKGLILLSWDTGAIVLVYLGAMGLSYLLRGA